MTNIIKGQHQNRLNMSDTITIVNHGNGDTETDPTQIASITERLNQMFKGVEIVTKALSAFI